MIRHLLEKPSNFYVSRNQIGPVRRNESAEMILLGSNSLNLNLSNPWGQNFQTSTAVKNESGLVKNGSGFFFILNFQFTAVYFDGPRPVQKGPAQIFFTAQD